MYHFEEAIRQLEGKIKWSVIYFPYSTQETFGSQGKIPVRITVDGHPFEHTLLPSRNGHYFVYNEFIKRAVGKTPGERVLVTLEEDTKERIYQVPEYIQKELQSNGVLSTYMSQPDYLKREQVHYIEVAKKEETQRNRLNRLIERLTEQTK